MICGKNLRKRNFWQNQEIMGSATSDWEVKGKKEKKESTERPDKHDKHTLQAR